MRTMTTLPKILLALSILLILASFTKAGGEFAWGCLKPLGAITFIGFYLVQLLEKETAAYDAEHRTHSAKNVR